MSCCWSSGGKGGTGILVRRIGPAGTGAPYRAPARFGWDTLCARVHRQPGQPGRTTATKSARNTPGPYASITTRAAVISHNTGVTRKFSHFPST